MTDFTDIELRIARLIDQVTPAGRAALARRIAADMRKTNAKRIRDNIEPDGGSMVPRQPRRQGKRLRDRIGPAALRGEKMFARANGAKHLRAKATADGAQIGFAGSTARIMRIHQLGLRGKVAPDGPSVSYPAREVLGISADDRARILTMIGDRFDA